MSPDPDPLPPCPTALLHFLGVEALPIYGFGLASWSAGTHFAAHVFLSTRFFGGPAGESPQPPTLLDHVDCLHRAVAALMWTGRATGAYTCPGCGTALECPRVFSPGALALLVACALGLTLLFVAWTVALFALRGLCCSRAGSGAYLWFTWELEARPAYRFIVMALLAATLLALGLLLAVILEGGGHHSLLSMVLMDAFVLCLCLWRLLQPRTGMHRWVDGQQLARCHFRRSWCKLPHLFPESNDAFASKLMDALWQAKHGDRRLLRRMVLDQADVDIYLSVFANMPSGEEEEEEGTELPLVSEEERSGEGWRRGRSLLPRRIGSRGPAEDSLEARFGPL